MSRLARAFSIIGPVAAVAWAAWPFTAVAPGVVEATSPAGSEVHVPVSPGLPVGAGGCAAAGCHGAPPTSLLKAPDAHCWMCSATHWLACDPHSRAYEALEGDLAIKIMAQLNQEIPPNTRKLKATEDVRCLACHTNPALVRSTQDPPPDRPDGRLADESFAPLQRDGVSCEACHGNASQWFLAHVNWDSSNRSERYSATQMTKLYDLGERAKMCAGCHVGAPADHPTPGHPVRDMNHDMIAAGHPRLNFDFADSQRRLPPHWYEKDRMNGSTARGADFDVQSWLIGRLAHAEAACDLLASRVDRKDIQNDPAPWPEFAEFACVSCHHVIANPDKPFPPPPAAGRRRAGSPAWQPIWPITRPDDVLALAPLVNPQKVIGDLKALIEVVEVPRPNPESTKAAAERAAGSLATLRQQLTQVPGNDVRAAVDRLLQKGLKTRLSEVDRDIACQLFYGLAAADRTQMRLGGKDKSAAFKRESQNLKFPPGKDQIRPGNVWFDIKPNAQEGLKELLP